MAGTHWDSFRADYGGCDREKEILLRYFGDTVNIAARIEFSGEPGKINVSAYSADLIQNQFSCTYRGKINAKGKGELDMYFVE